MKTTYRSRVAGYELDSNGHVNNAVYLNYLEAARWEGFYQIGAMELLKELDISPIITETQIKYMKELLMFDDFEIITEWASTGVFILNKHKIKDKEGKIVAKAESKLLLVSKERVIYDIPEELGEKLNRKETL
ncbi:acyl-CoA thioesterase [[Clostridium] polysaccharolyticum]|uniref:Acyl-CoA thioester hydrolase n=1 Tax=[Clostridium] polysaccharolyticum TaxID=29364 RepID=A0A1I0EEC0_9FIRM|nr:acyl-CoA thioesterase [[Clostridium] polysaccharolyticum]SET43330.1 acyl-CoA thioester hydrolase [[Clostridium] polysaccharolyticum]